MLKELKAAIVIFLALTFVTGIVYPLLVTAVAQLVFPHQANGSLIVQGDKIIGSQLLGQGFDDPKYFWGRPSATAAFPYDASSSTGSNFGPTNPDQLKAVSARLDAIHKAQPDDPRLVPVELVTASASGLDPEISPAAAEFQIARIAKARDVSEEKIRALVAAQTQGRTLGVLGEPCVNVLKLNLALDAPIK
ncbi:MAG TPA: potassium-transporting ATPase subunit KdpC [Pirellulales bacterium]|jgi:K+-transporting ATPase ATPase C chain|nr:potassium-transporting ATPase subunit KdpC [Pirellulales bacterium]